jgi:hypothetical protein
VSDQNLRASIGQAIRDIATYKTPDVSNVQAQLDSILRAAGLHGIAKDVLDALHFQDGDLHIDSSWGARGNICSGMKRVPESVIDADDPLAAAKLWGSDQRIKNAKGKIWQATESIENYSMSLEELIAARREFDPEYASESSPPLPQQGGGTAEIANAAQAFIECATEHRNTDFSDLSHELETKFDRTRAVLQKAISHAAVLPQVGEATTPTNQELHGAYQLHDGHFEGLRTVYNLNRTAPASLGEAKAVHFYRQKVGGRWIECENDYDPRICGNERIFEYRTLYAAPVAEALPVAAEKDEAEEYDPICNACDGTGEGMTDRTSCRSCGGSGVRSGEKA